MHWQFHWELGRPAHSTGKLCEPILRCSQVEISLLEENDHIQQGSAELTDERFQDSGYKNESNTDKRQIKYEDTVV